MTMTWVLIADDNAAKILIPNKGSLDAGLEKEFIHPKAARIAFDAKTDVVDDFKRAMPVQPEVLDTSKTQASHREDFAREIGSYLEKAHTLNRFDKLILVAAPAMLGKLKLELVKSVKHAVTHELERDLLGVGLSNVELLDKVRGDLGIQSF